MRGGVGLAHPDTAASDAIARGGLKTNSAARHSPKPGPAQTLHRRTIRRLPGRSQLVRAPPRNIDSPVHRNRFRPEIRALDQQPPPVPRSTGALGPDGSPDPPPPAPHPDAIRAGGRSRTACRSHRYTAGSRTAPGPRRWRVPCPPARRRYRPGAPDTSAAVLRSRPKAPPRAPRSRSSGRSKPSASRASGAARSTCHISVLPGPAAESGGCTCTESFSEVKRNFTSRRGSSGALNQTSPVLPVPRGYQGSVSGVPQTFSSAVERSRLTFTVPL